MTVSQLSWLEELPQATRDRLGTTQSVTRLGGLTNQNFLVVGERAKAVVRQAGAGTHAYINRASERQAAEEASRLGVGAELWHFDVTSGVQVCAYLEGAKTMTAEAFRAPGTVERAALCFRRLHREAAPFLTRFELFAMIDTYLEILAKKGATLPAEFASARTQAEAARAALSSRALPTAPCHCDPLAENFLDTGTRMYLIDWEYCGNNDPMWDLADLAVEAEFGASQEERLLNSYFNGRVPAYERGRVVLYKALCDLLWTLWGLIQHADGNTVQDFMAYSLGRLERCRKLMSQPLFAAALATVRAGPA